jgi:hypothetical protein
MPQWRMTGEPSLDELLGDDTMRRVMQSAGLDAMEMRRRLVDLARRLSDRRQAGSSRRAAFC